MGYYFFSITVKIIIVSTNLTPCITSNSFLFRVTAILTSGMPYPATYNGHRYNTDLNIHRVHTAITQIGNTHNAGISNIFKLNDCNLR